MNIFLASADPVRRATLSTICLQESDVRIVGQADHCRVLLSTIGLVRPDLLLLDWDLPFFQGAGPTNAGAAMIHAMTLDDRQLRIVAFCTRPELEKTALAAGADGFFYTETASAQVAANLRVNKRRVRSPFSNVASGVK